MHEDDFAPKVNFARVTFLHEKKHRIKVKIIKTKKLFGKKKLLTED